MHRVSLIWKQTYGQRLQITSAAILLDNKSKQSGSI